MSKKMMKLLILMIVSTNAYAEIELGQHSYKQITITREKCNEDFRTLIADYCSIAIDKLQEIHRDSFRMHTQAENSLEEWAMFADYQGYYRIYRNFEFDDSNYENDYCFTKITCIE